MRVIGLGLTSGCTAGACPAAGGLIDVYGSGHEVVGNEIYGSTDNGIYTDDFSSNILIRNNYVHDNGTVVDVNQDHGVYLQGTNNVLAGNSFVNHPHGYCIQVGDVGSNPDVVWNFCDNQGAERQCCAGIVAWSSSMTGVLIERNYIMRTFGLGIENNGGGGGCRSVSHNRLNGEGIDSFPCSMIGNG